MVDIAGDALKGDPARLADEFGAMSLMGGRRVIRVRPAGEESVAALENLAGAGAGDALIVLEGGNLTPRSGLRTLAETEANLAALPCYADNAEDLERLVASAARAEASRSKRTRSTGSSSGWAAIAARAAARSTSCCCTSPTIPTRPSPSPTPPRCWATPRRWTSTTSSARPSTATSSTLDRALDRVFAEGGNAVQLVRALQRHADQLHLVSGHAKGGNFEAAMFKARSLPRGGPVRRRFENHLRAGRCRASARRCSRILDAELECKTTGFPDEAIARRLCLRSRARRRPPASARRQASPHPPERPPRTTGRRRSGGRRRGPAVPSTWRHAPARRDWRARYRRRSSARRPLRTAGRRARGPSRHPPCGGRGRNRSKAAAGSRAVRHRGAPPCRPRRRAARGRPG